MDAVLLRFREGAENYQLAALGLAVIDGLRQIPRAVVPDMPDRIIAATALGMNLPLVSTDSKISGLEALEVIW